MSFDLRDPYLESVVSTNNGENFSLSEFFRTEATNLKERVKPFSDYFRESRARGLAQYGREIMSPVSNRVQVRGVDGATREMVMFGSNNYLGLTTHPHVLKRIHDAIEVFGAGVGGPPLLGGTTKIHKELEERLSIWKGSEDTLLYGSGYQANLGWVTTLLRDGDVLLYDEYNHASLYDGIALKAASTTLKAIRFAHNDTAHLERLLARARKNSTIPNRQIFVVTEGVFSMEGDLAPLPQISKLCREYDAILVVDDAHGTGVMGKNGHGTSAHFSMTSGIDLCMGSFSKAFGMTGGFLSGDREVIDYLRFCSRSYMFSAHLPIATVAGVLGGMEVIEREPDRIARLQLNATYLEAGLCALGFKTFREAAIIPVRIPADVNIREVCREFDDAGIFLNSIEFPAVSKDGQRLRLSVMSTHTLEDLDAAIDAFERIGKNTGILSSSSS